MKIAKDKPLHCRFNRFCRFAKGFAASSTAPPILHALDAVVYTTSLLQNKLFLQWVISLHFIINFLYDYFGKGD